MPSSGVPDRPRWRRARPRWWPPATAAREWPSAPRADRRAPSCRACRHPDKPSPAATPKRERELPPATLPGSAVPARVETRPRQSYSKCTFARKTDRQCKRRPLDLIVPASAPARRLGCPRLAPLSPAVTLIRPVIIANAVLTQLPAQVNFFVVDDRRKIQQTDIQIFNQAPSRQYLFQISLHHVGQTVMLH